MKGGPAERRAFLDSALCQAKPSYAIAYARYRRTLNQRNALLKDIARHPELEDTLPIWDDRLCRSGAVLIRERRAYLERFAPRASAHYAGIAHGREELRLTYEPSCGGDMAESLRPRVCARTSVSAHTSVGPHRDDIWESRIGGMAARLYASQGQQAQQRRARHEAGGGRRAGRSVRRGTGRLSRRRASAELDGFAPALVCSRA